MSDESGTVGYQNTIAEYTEKGIGVLFTLAGFSFLIIVINVLFFGSNQSPIINFIGGLVMLVCVCMILVVLWVAETWGVPHAE